RPPERAVLSTHVEVVRTGSTPRDVRTSALHARGGGPIPAYLPGVAYVCSPRTWRWSVRRLPGGDLLGVLSTHVEVVRGHPRPRARRRGALHARGGGPLLPAGASEDH